MLCVNNYGKEYIDECRSRMESQLATYNQLRAAVGSSAFDAFEPQFFNHLVLVLDAYFVHRTRGLEGKNGNPANEVRVMCNSLLIHKGVMTAEKSIKLDPSKSVLKIPMGQDIKLIGPEFERLFKAYFAEIEARFL